MSSMKAGVLLVVFNCLPLCVGSLLVPTELVAQTEVFLLQPKLHYLYRLERTRYYQDPSFFDYSETRDSGSVEYIVMDSARVNDSTASWNIVQRRHLLHGYSDDSGNDSLLWIVDSTVVTISEMTRGLHELRIASEIWNFPVQDKDVENAIYRYAETSYLPVFIHIERGTGPVDDSLWFSDALGFFKRRLKMQWIYGMNSTTITLSVELDSPPIISIEPENPISTRFDLQQNYPNPFNPTTTIKYELPKSSEVRLSVYDLLGREVSVLVNERKNAGSYQVKFEGSGLASGVYLYQLTAGDFVQAKKFMLVR